MHFDCERIINDSFDSVFGESEEAVNDDREEDDDGYDIIWEDDV